MRLRGRYTHRWNHNSRLLTVMAVSFKYLMAWNVATRLLRAVSGAMVVIVASLLSLVSLPAQTNTSRLPGHLASEYIIDLWETDHGLPQNSINDIVQTRDGYLWLATYDGLVRFNGVDFTVFTMANVPQLKSNRMVSLFEDSRGSLWIGTEQGGLVRLHEGVFTTYSSEAGLESDIVLSIAEMPEGTLWIGTSGAGLYRMRNERFTKVFTAKGEWLSGVVGALLVDSHGRFWIGTGNGLHVMNNGVIERVPETGSYNISALLEDGSGGIWAGSGFGVFRFEKGVWTRFTERDGLRDIRTTSLLLDREGTLWLGTMSGVSRYRGGRWSSDGLAEDNSSIHVQSMYQDRENNLWLGTNSNGLARLKKRIIQVYTREQGLSHDVILAVFQDRAGTMWIGTNCGGLNRFRDGVFTNMSARYQIPDDCIWSIWEDRKGRLWTGSWGGGLYTYSGNKHVRYTETTGLSNNIVLAMYDDRSGNFWAGTRNGLNRIRGDSITIYRTGDGIAHEDIRVLAEDSAGTLWIGTFGGLTRYSGGRFTSFTTDDGLSNNYVRAIHPDRNGVLWIGTYGGGLNRLKDGKFTRYTTADGLFDNGVFHILEDNHGNFWMSSNKGIFRVKKQELEEFAAGARTRISSVAYGKEDGMRNRECNGGFQPAGWKTTDGRLWFPTIRGLVVIDPDKINTNTLPPPVVIERFIADSSVVSLQEPVVLPGETERLEFHYAGLSYSAPQRVVFRYKLEGFDQGWIEAGNRRTAYYTNIPPGSYTFRVAAANEDGIWNDDGASWTFEVQSFFYQKGWFYTVCAFSVIGLAVGFYFLRVRHLVRLNLELEDRVSFRTEEVVEQKNQLARVNVELSTLLVQLEEKSRQLQFSKVRAEEANNAKSQFLAIVSHELRTPLNSVIGFANILFKKKRGKLDEEDLLYVERILENGKHLLTLIDGVLDLSKIEAGRGDVTIERVSLTHLIQDTIDQLEGRLLEKEVTLDRDLPEKEIYLETDEGKLKQILINLIGNAIKFTDRGTICVRLIVDPSSRKPQRIDVIDSGIGIPPDRREAIFEPFRQADSSTTRRFGGTGLGLTISNRFAELLGYRLALKSQEGKGSTFSILLTNDAPQP